MLLWCEEERRRGIGVASGPLWRYLTMTHSGQQAHWRTMRLAGNEAAHVKPDCE